MTVRIGVHVELDRSAYSRFTSETLARATRKAASVTAKRARDNVARAGRVRTGHMMSSIRARPVQQGGDPERTSALVIGSAHYTIYQEMGTSRGVRPAWFMRDALEALTPADYA